MATIIERRGKFCVVYDLKDENGKRRQKWETYDSRSRAKKRVKEIEYKKAEDTLIIPNCKTLEELLDEYVNLYGREKWSLSTYDGNIGLINHYILPKIGKTKLSDISIRFLESYYQGLLKTPAVVNSSIGKSVNSYVSTSTIRDIHKILKSAFRQAVKWELMCSNPAENTTVPKHKSKKREIWTAEIFMDAIEKCEDEQLKLALNLSFSGSLRIGELLALTWDCVDISEETIQSNSSYILVNKELIRVSKKAVKELDSKDILFIFPEKDKLCTTVRILKTPKTESSIRKIFLPKSVAEMLAKKKSEQESLKEMLGEEYHDYNLVMTSSYGTPASDSRIRKKLKKLIEDYNLPPVVFHSFRHSSITYKLKLNGGDIKAVQGDSGHAQVNMVTDVYSHIIDEDRKKNAELFEEAFYGKKNLNPQLHETSSSGQALLPEDEDSKILTEILANPETKALLMSLMKSIKKE